MNMIINNESNVKTPRRGEPFSLAVNILNGNIRICSAAALRIVSDNSISITSPMNIVLCMGHAKQKFLKAACCCTRFARPWGLPILQTASQILKGGLTKSEIWIITQPYNNIFYLKRDNRKK
jgi:hypothetical protein